MELGRSHADAGAVPLLNLPVRAEFGVVGEDALLAHALRELQAIGEHLLSVDGVLCLLEPHLYAGASSQSSGGELARLSFV
ncbi:MAG: hypothetical protein ACYDC5_09100 [Candidatus Dormibacteria bacterium]